MMKEAIRGLTGEDVMAFVSFCAFAATTLLWGGHWSLVGA